VFVEDVVKNHTGELACNYRLLLRPDSFQKMVSHLVLLSRTCKQGGVVKKLRGAAGFIGRCAIHQVRLRWPLYVRGQVCAASTVTGPGRFPAVGPQNKLRYVARVKITMAAPGAVPRSGRSSLNRLSVSKSLLKG
jgi:hypothetical protein